MGHITFGGNGAMKHIFRFGAASVMFGLLAFVTTQDVTAQTPPEVLKPYKAYNAAISKGDFKAAIKQAKAAWQAAEKSMGENATTGDLAFNYGFIEKNQGDGKKSIKPLKRAVELASLQNENAATIQLERELELIGALEMIGDGSEAASRVRDAFELVEKAGLPNSVFVGELHLLDANACFRNLNAKITRGQQQTGSFVKTAGSDRGIRDGRAKCATFAQRAVDNFELNADTARPAYVAAAYNYVGFALEAKNSWYSAAMNFQKARDAVEPVYDRDHPVVADAIGRWLNARNYLERTGRLEYALDNGLCECWPYGDNRETVRPVSTVDPKFPAAALNRTSGYAIVQFDVSDSGKTENVKILNSWPGDVYDKSAIKAIEQWEYPGVCVFDKPIESALYTSSF